MAYKFVRVQGQDHVVRGVACAEIFGCGEVVDPLEIVNLVSVPFGNLF